jgi:2'-5' RNA ligase
MEKILGPEKTYYRPQGLFEYMLIISPGMDVYDKIMEEKQFFSRNYGQPIAVKTKPHITISNFLAWDNMEDSLISWLQRVVMQQTGFWVTLNNYSGFPSHTIFIRIQDAEPFKKLATDLKAITPYIKMNSSMPPRFVNNPHLTIARCLPADVYENAIRDYSRRDFAASFDVKELVLLRRQHQYDACKEISVFRLQPNVYTNN